MEENVKEVSLDFQLFEKVMNVNLDEIYEDVYPGPSYPSECRMPEDDIKEYGIDKLIGDVGIANRIDDKTLGLMYSGSDNSWAGFEKVEPEVYNFIKRTKEEEKETIENLKDENGNLYCFKPAEPKKDLKMVEIFDALGTDNQAWANDAKPRVAKGLSNRFENIKFDWKKTYDEVGEIADRLFVTCKCNLLKSNEIELNFTEKELLELKKGLDSVYSDQNEITDTIVDILEKTLKKVFKEVK